MNACPSLHPARLGPLTCLLALCGGPGMLSAHAASPAITPPASMVVESVQAPAWRWRQGERLPLSPGQSIENDDRIVTGNDARVLLRLPEGSAIKLGADAELRVAALPENQQKSAQKPDLSGVFTAALEVVTGAFRFTTGLFDRAANLSGRNLSIRAATLTAGIRGTDVWGSSSPGRNLICLIEGQVSVSHPQAPSVQLSVPMSVYTAPPDAAPLPPVQVDAETLAGWAAETEMPANGGRSRHGKWQLQLTGQYSEPEALAEYDRLRAAGYAARIRPEPSRPEPNRAGPGDGSAAATSTASPYHYRVLLEGYQSQAAAEAEAWRLLQTLELSTRMRRKP